MLCVDPWSAAERCQYDDGAGVNDWADRMDFDLARRIFEISLAGFERGDVNYLRATSAMGARVYAAQRSVTTEAFGRTSYEGRIALLHIDGNHDFTSVSQDIALWYACVVPGGWIIIDDYRWAFGDGPRRAGDAMLSDEAIAHDSAFVAGSALFIRLAESESS